MSNNSFKNIFLTFIVALAIVLWAVVLATLVITENLTITTKTAADPIEITPLVMFVSPTESPMVQATETPEPTQTPVPTEEVFVPTETPYFPTPFPSCFNNEYAEILFSMNIREEPHISSPKTIYVSNSSSVYNHIPAPKIVRVLYSEQHPDYCWLRLDGDYNNGWLADTTNVRTPVPR